MKKLLFLVIFINLILCRFSVAEQAIQDGVKKHYFPNGSVMVESTYKGGKEISRKVYYKNGNPEFEFIYINGEKEYLEKNYFRNGKLRIETHKPFGEFKAYDENGRLRLETYHNELGDETSRRAYDENGNIIINGVLTDYYDGKLLDETPYKNGKRDGIGKVYYPSGKIRSEIFFENGEEISYKEYDEKGNLIISKKHGALPQKVE